MNRGSCSRVERNGEIFVNEAQRLDSNRLDLLTSKQFTSRTASCEIAREIDSLIRPPSKPASFCLALIGPAIKHKHIAPRDEQTIHSSFHRVAQRAASRIDRRAKNKPPIVPITRQKLVVACDDHAASISPTSSGARSRIVRFRDSSCAPCSL